MIDIKNLLLFLAGTLNFILGALIFAKNRKERINQFYALVVVSTACWSFSLLLFRITPDLFMAEIWAKVFYISANMIGISFFLFCTYFPYKSEKFSKIVKSIAIAFSCLVVLTSAWPNMMIRGINVYDWGKEVVLHPPTYILYIIYFLGVMIIALYELYRKYRQSDLAIRTQLRFAIVGYVTAIIGGIIFNLIVPLWNYQLIWVGPLFTVILSVLIAYAIFKHHLFHIKIVAVELFVGLINIVLLIDALLSPKIPSTEFFLKITVFLLMVFFSIMLIKSVLKEEKHKEELEKIAKELRSANVELRQLDKTKSEFISIASHQLLTPLTPIRGYSAMLINGDYGEIPEKQKEVLQMIHGSSKRLVGLVSNLLDISRIERGTVEYDFAPTPVDKIAQSVVNELIPTAEKKKIKILYDVPKEKIPSIFADGDKIREVLLNLIDNSIKYTLKGDINVNLQLEGDFILISINDNGIGMNVSDISKLFKKFSRSEAVKAIHVGGSGLGLYVARKHVEAHHGQVWAESPGRGAGSTFFVRLPVHKRRAVG